MTETPMNEPPHPPIIARKPDRVVSSIRRSVGDRKPHDNVARHMLTGIPAQQQDVEGGDANG